MKKFLRTGASVGAISCALGFTLAPSAAQATCTFTPGVTTTVNCTGTTNFSSTTPIVTLGNVAITLGSDGNPATVTNSGGTPFSVTLTGPTGTYGSLDTGNTGTPSSVTGSTDGGDATSTGSANILIGQNSAGGNGLNANITGQSGAGFNLAATGTGSILVTMAPGTAITGATNGINVSTTTGGLSLTLNGNATGGTNAIQASSTTGNISLVFNGNLQTTNPTSFWDVSAGSSGGNITIGGSGSALSGGITLATSGSGTITVGGSVSVTDTSGPGINVNETSSGAIVISTTGAITGTGTSATFASGIDAINSGTGSISITGTGAVNGYDGIYTSASGGNITISPASSVNGTNDAIYASTTGSGTITITTAGAIAGGSGYGIDVAAAGGTTTINVNSGSTISGGAGSIYLGGTTSIINNSGTITGLIAGTNIDPLTINNAGTFNISSATGTNVQTLNTFNGQGGTLVVSVNPSAGTADLLKVANLSGSTHVTANVIGSTTTISSPITFLEASNVASGTTVTANSSGLFTYGVKSIADPTTPGQTDYQLFSALNVPVAAAAPQTIDTVITALETGFFQNSSAFISEPPNPRPNQINGGPWIRFATGNDTTFGTATAFTPGGTPANSPEKLSTNFSGFQAGVDLGVANVQNTGWNTHIGVTTGEVILDVNDLVTTSISNQTRVTFIGLYGAITGHGFFADAQVRGDFYGMNINNPMAGLTEAPLTGTAIAFNTSVGYHFNLPHNWFVEPSAAFLYDRLSVPNLSYGALGVQTFNPFQSDIGRFGVRVGTTYVFDKVHVAVQPFAVGSVWHEFAGNTTSSFISGGVATPLSVTRIGTFGQASAGVSAQILDTGFLGFARADYRFGDFLRGYAAVVGMRYAF